MADMILEPIMEKLISAGIRYLKDQVTWQKQTEELEKLKEILPQIQAVDHFSSSQEQTTYQNQALKKWLWQLRDAIDDANDVLDELEYLELEKQAIKKKKLPRMPSTMKNMKKRLAKIGKRAHKINVTFKRLEHAAQELCRLSTNVTSFLDLVKDAKQEDKGQQLELYRARETGCLPKTDLIGRGKEKKLVMEWLRSPSHGGRTTLYSIISLLSIVGHGGVGKTTLLQHIYEAEMTKGFFDLKLWVYVSKNFDVKKVIADMLESLKDERPRLETLGVLQRSLKDAVFSRRFLLVLDDVWEEEEGQDKSKWGDVLAPLASGDFESKILVTTRTESVALMFEEIIKKKTKIVKLRSLEEDQHLQLLSSHAFAGPSDDDDKKLRAIAEEAVHKSNLNIRDKATKLVLEWVGNSSNEPQGTDLYRHISLLSIVGDGGTGKTTLLQRVYEDEITKEFDLKMWICVSNKFNVKKVIADMLESLKRDMPHLETLDALQNSLRIEIMSKKFLLILDDIWDEEVNLDINKWEKLLAPLAYGKIGSRILITTRTDSVALMFAKVTKKEKIVKLEGLEEDECLQLLNSHAFAGVENLYDDDHKKLRAIAGEIVKKLVRSPLAAKVIGGVLNDNLDIRHWWEVLQSNLLGENSISSILTLSYIVLPNHLRNCFAFCCMFPQDHTFDKDDLVQMWIALGFIQPSQDMTLEDTGGKYFDVLVQKALIDKVGDDYKMHDLIHESASIFFAQECGKLVDDEESSHTISESIRYLSIRATNVDVFRKIEKFKHLHSLFLFDEATSSKDLFIGLIEIFKSSRSLRVLYIHALKGLKMIPEGIKNLIHLRYLKIDSYYLAMLPNSLSNLYHLAVLAIGKYSNLISLGEMPTANNCQVYLSDLSISDPSVLLREPLRSIASLKRLSIHDNDKLVSFPDKAEQWFLRVRSSLTELEFKRLKSLESLPYFLECLSSLQKLVLHDVPMLRELPNLPPSLKCLQIWGRCHQNLMDRNRRISAGTAANPFDDVEDDVYEDYLGDLPR